jgi:hypothetical protein
VADFYRQSGRIFPCRWQDANGICSGSLPSFSLFLKICNVLGTSADYLLGDLLEHPVIPDSVEQLGKQLKHLEPDQVDMVNEMIEPEVYGEFKDKFTF